MHRSCWATAPAERPSFSQVADCLQLMLDSGDVCEAVHDDEAPLPAEPGDSAAGSTRSSAAAGSQQGSGQQRASAASTPPQPLAPSRHVQDL